MIDRPVAGASAPDPSGEELGFDSLGALRSAHLAFIQTRAEHSGSSRGPEAAEEIRTFLRKASATGAVLGDTDDRHAAQRILDYWSAELVADPNVNIESFGLARLAPFSDGGARPVGSNGASADSREAEIAADRRQPRQSEARAQIRLAATARLWKDSGRDPGYLLTGQALVDAAAYSSSDPDVMELVIASQARASRRRWILVGAGAFIIASILYLAAPFLVQSYKDYRYHSATAQWRDIVVNSKAIEARRQAFLQMANYDQTIRLQNETIEDLSLLAMSIPFPVDFTNARLRGLIMGNTYGQQATDPVLINFTGSIIDQSRFLSANLRRALFVGCTIQSTSTDKNRETSFAKAILFGADFSKCRIEGVSFDQANLSGANFTESNVSRSNFNGADVSGANFSRANVVGSQGNTFLGTAWWLAAGWTYEDIATLERTFPHVSFVRSPSYREEDIRLKSAAAQAHEIFDAYPPIYDEDRRKNDLASALNILAWHRAVNGVELQDAEKDVREALGYVPNSPYIKDTLGYILLQKDQYAEAAQVYGSFLDDPGADSAQASGGAQYRYGLVFKGLGQDDKARDWVCRSERAHYVPTHERVFVKAQVAACPQ